MNKSPTQGDTFDELFATRLAELPDWQRPILTKLRALVRAAVPDIVEEWKWNIPVWSHSGIVCTGEAYKNAVKMTFAKGASIKDPKKIFNSSLEGNARRAIDFPKGATLDETGIKQLVRDAVAFNQASPTAKAKASSKSTAKHTGIKKAAKLPARASRPRPSRAGKS